MKKTFLALIVAGVSVTGAMAQNRQTVSCGIRDNEVCRISSDKKSAYCYKTQYAANFKVCKGDFGYFICCEPAGMTNSTHPPFVAVGGEAMEPETDVFTFRHHKSSGQPVAIAVAVQTVPQSQSYPFDPNEDLTSPKVVPAEEYKPEPAASCYTGSNVALLNRAPYHGCPSPQYEGPEVNYVRNLNFNNASYDLPPTTGRPHE